MYFSLLRRACALLTGGLATLLLVGLFSACASPSQRAVPEESDPGIETALALIGPGWPADTQQRATTSGEIYLANLDSQIAALTKRVERLGDDRSLARLALLHYHRFQVLGTLPDAIAARDLLESAEARPHHSSIDLAAAHVLLGFHRFEEARLALQRAAASGAASEAIQVRQRAIDAATGPIAPDADPADRVLAAADLADRGRPADAARLLREAQDLYADTSPYELSWLQVQQGIVFLRYGEPRAAQRFFAAAHERFPQFALAAEHLAETELALGRAEAARRLYLQVAEQTGNPEFWFRLSRAERQLGLTAAANHHARLAGEGYEALLAEVPAMYADHAARYFIDAGDAARAHQLARASFDERRNVGALSLLIETAAEIGDRQLACRLLDQVRTRGYEPPELRALTKAYPEDCGRPPA